MSSSISIKLLICIVVFLPSCLSGETELNKEGIVIFLTLVLFIFLYIQVDFND